MALSGTATTLSRLHGHEGSIFSVALSPLYSTERYLASCSDDRTVRVWNITHPDTPAATRGTGFGAAGAGGCAVGWGHTARIWGVEFVPGEEVAVVSVSEDLTARFWREQGGKLVETKTYRLHSGKHVWSFALQDGLLATGGADGKVALVEYGLSAEEGVWDVGEDVAREYVVLDEDRFVMTTVGGRVLVCTVSTGTWRAAAAVDGLRGWSVVAAWRGSGMIALGGRGSVGVLWIDEGRETWWDIDPGKVGGIWTSHNQDFHYFLTTSLSTPTFTLHTLPRSGHRTSTTLTPPHEPGEKRFLVTAMSLSNTPLALLLGSRSGAIAAYDLSGALLGCWRGIYADAVSAIKCVDSRVFTTGRNGDWSVLAVDNGALTVQHTGRAACTVLEGLSVDDRVSLHGFHGKRFGVWDSSGAEVASVECGGSHRSWCFQGEWFVWTKAGKVCWFMEYHSAGGALTVRLGWFV